MTSAVQDSQTPRCLACDYPLLGLSEHRCPECGRAFDPANPRTMRTPRSPGKVAQFLMKPPGWPLFITVGLAAFYSLVAGAAPGGYLLPAALAIWSWIAVFVVGGARLLAWISLRAYFSKDCELGPRHTRRWIVGPVALAIVVFLLIGRVPLFFAFWVSRSSLENLVQEVVDGSDASPSPRRVGLFYAKEIERTPSGMRFVTKGNGLYIREGFAWSATPLTISDDGNNRYSHLYGNWYTWIEDW